MKRISNFMGRLRTMAGIHKWLLLSCCFSCGLLVCRIVVTGTWNYLFLVWNLWLALLPYWLTENILHRYSVLKSRWKLSLVLCAWLLFIPNSFYIITDIFHFARFQNAPRWFDLLLLFSFACNGIMAGLVSMGRAERLLELMKGKRVSVLMVFSTMWLIALGIYIGRFMRYNSWDIIRQPVSLFADIGDMILHPVEHGYAWGMTICYGAFMGLLYQSIKNAGKLFRRKN